MKQDRRDAVDNDTLLLIVVLVVVLGGGAWYGRGRLFNRQAEKESDAD